MKIHSAVPENGCLIFFDGRKNKKKTKKRQKQEKIKVHGRARRDAARRRKSEWKVNLDIRNSSRSNGSWRMRNSIVEPRGV